MYSVTVKTKVVLYATSDVRMFYFTRFNPRSKSRKLWVGPEFLKP